MKAIHKKIIIIVSIVLAVAIVLGSAAIALVKYWSANEKPAAVPPPPATTESGDSVFVGSNNASTQSSTQSNTSSKPKNNKTSSTASKEESATNGSRPEKILETFPLRDIFTQPEFQKLTYTDKVSGKKLPYSLYIPEGYSKAKKYPVLLFLHGAGERGTDNTTTAYLEPMFKQSSDLVKNAIIISPQCPQDGWWDIDEQGNEDGWLGAALHLLYDIEAKYSCDKDRIYVMGLSMGGYATWSLLERYGDHFAAGIPICGWGNPYAADVLKNIPIWIYHGTADPTVSIESSEEMYNAITSAGGSKIHFTRLPGVTHEAWIPAFKSRELFSWLFAQNKKTNPSGKFQVEPYLKVIDPNGKTIFSELDTTLISHTLFEGSGQVELTLTNDAAKKLKSAYKTHKGKTFSITYGGNKIMTFTPTKNQPDNLFYIARVFDYTDFHTYFGKVSENAEAFGAF